MRKHSKVQRCAGGKLPPKWNIFMTTAIHRVRPRVALSARRRRAAGLRGHTGLDEPCWNWQDLRFLLGLGPLALRAWQVWAPSGRPFVLRVQNVHNRTGGIVAGPGRRRQPSCSSEENGYRMMNRGSVIRCQVTELANAITASCRLTTENRMQVKRNISLRTDTRTTLLPGYRLPCNTSGRPGGRVPECPGPGPSPWSI